MSNQASSRPSSRASGLVAADPVRRGQGRGQAVGCKNPVPARRSGCSMCRPVRSARERNRCDAHAVHAGHCPACGRQRLRPGRVKALGGQRPSARLVQRDVAGTGWHTAPAPARRAWRRGRTPATPGPALHRLERPRLTVWRDRPTRWPSSSCDSTSRRRPCQNTRLRYSATRCSGERRRPASIMVMAWPRRRFRCATRYWLKGRLCGQQVVEIGARQAQQHGVAQGDHVITPRLGFQHRAFAEPFAVRHAEKGRDAAVGRRCFAA